MEPSSQDVLDRLAAAIDDWDAQWEACHQQIEDTLVHAQCHVEQMRETAAGPPDDREALIEEMIQLREALAERERLLYASNQRIEELESQIAGLCESLDALLLEKDQPQSAVPPESEPSLHETVVPEPEEPAAALPGEPESASEASAAAGDPSESSDEDAAAPHAFLEIPAFDEKGHKRRMGEILVDLGVVTRKQLKEMLSEQNRDPQRRLGTLAVTHGYTDEELVARILAAQLNLPFVRLADAEIDTAALNKVTPQIARSRKCVPLAVDGDLLRIAMANPLDLIAVEDIEISTRLRVETVVATPGEVEAALRTFYGTH